jgi:hypothetical protein
MVQVSVRNRREGVRETHRKIKLGDTKNILISFTVISVSCCDSVSFYVLFLLNVTQKESSFVDD